MDKNGKKVVAFSFFDEKEDYREIKSLFKDELKSTPGWDNARKRGATPSTQNFQDKDFMSDHFKADIDKYWRPSTALALSLKSIGVDIDEYHLIFQPQWGGKGFQEKAATYIKEAIKRLVAPNQIKVSLDPIYIGNGHDFETVYCALYDYFQDYLCEHKKEHNCENRPRYLVHVTSGSQAARMCLFLLAQNRWIPAECVQLWTEDPKDKNQIGKCAITNPVLSSSKSKMLADLRKKNAETNQSTLKQHIKTQDKSYNKIIEDIEMIATRTNEPILLLGDTGVGKSVIAKQVFEVRKSNNLIPPNVMFQHFNCSGFKGDLVDSILFGHVEGAFTGATSDKMGIIGLANEGVLFLDEIGNLPLETQGKLLTVLDTHTFHMLGDYKTEKKSKFLLICATNEDLAQRVEEKTFRRDLFERIRTWTYTIPGLANRKDDIAPNIKEELKRFENEYGRRVTLDGQPFEQFLNYVKSIPLKGNFRELRRMIWHMATFADNGVINMDLVDMEIKQHKSENAPHTQSNAKTSVMDTTVGPNKSNAGDLADKLLLQLFGDGYKIKFDPLFLCQLRYVISVCCQGSTRSAADVGRTISPARLRQSKNGGNANNILANFFKRKEIREYRLSFAKIRELANLPRLIGSH